MKKYKIMIMHLSHTDIGYKDTQVRIKAIQIANLLDVIQNIEKYDGFTWNIESYGILDLFLNNFPEHEDKISDLIKKNIIGISTNFWNYTKIASPFLIDIAFKRVKQFVKKNNLEKYAQSFITNDINGYAKDWAIKALDSGTKNLYFGLHWSHGYYPAWKKQEPFFWEIDKNKKVLVWIGDQYAVGNNFGLVPGPISDYISSDGRTANENIKDQINLAVLRMSDLIKQLNDDNYPFDIIPITVLGTGADNDPINFAILERIKLLSPKWKELGIKSIRMSTIQEFFNEIHKSDLSNIKTYKGEWPDWWADGAASNPFALKAFKEAQRSYETLVRMSNKNWPNIENNLLLYSEHTYGTEWCTIEPFSFYNKQTEELKRSYALRALEEVKYEMDKETNWTSSKVKDDQKIILKIFNYSLSKVYKRVNLKSFIGINEHSKILNKNIIIKDSDGNMIPYSFKITEHPIQPTWTEKDIVIHIYLKSNETKIVIIDIENMKDKITRIANQYETKLGGMPNDIINIKNNSKGITYNNGLLLSKFCSINFNDKGISSFIYCKDELIKESKIPFTPIRYFDKQKNDYKVQYNSRFKMGRNIISNNSIKKEAKYINHQVNISNDGHNVEIIINYKLKGTQLLDVKYKISNFDPLIEVSIEMIKNPSWSNETLFFTMPNRKFKIEYGSTYEVNKGQIDGTLLNYHSLNEGLVYKSFKINHLDTSLVYSGPIVFSQMRLANDPKINANSFDEHYSILITNNWETNFSVDQGGFHEFRYIISPISDENNVEEELFGQAISPIIKRM